MDKTFHVRFIGGGIPSIEIAKSIALDVFRYGLWGYGYTDREGMIRRADVILHPVNDGCIEVLIAGWQAPASLITEEKR